MTALDTATDGPVLTLNQVQAANVILRNLEDLARALGTYVHCQSRDPEVSAIAREEVDLYVRRAAPSFSRLLAGDFLDSLREVHDSQREMLEPSVGLPLGTQPNSVVCFTCGALGEGNCLVIAHENTSPSDAAWVLDTPDASQATVGDAPGRSDSPSGGSGATSGGAL